MDFSEPYNLDGHLGKCRICIQILNDTSQAIRITEEIESKFFAVTQVELKISKMYSNTICGSCDKELENFWRFKLAVKKRQLQLYEEFPAVMEIKPDILGINIKQEFDEFEDFQDEPIEDDHFTSNLEMLRENLVKMKEPVNEVKAEKSQRKAKSGSSKKQRKLCPDCGKYVIELARHWRRSHSKIINFICDLCGYGTLLRHRMVKHMSNRHTDRELRQKFQCRYCDFLTVDKSYLRIHEQSHTANKGAFRCHCGKEYNNKHVLAQHILMTHEKKYRFKCKFCSKAYPTRGTLKEHMVTKHTKKDVRDCVCEICAKSFITDTQLKAHIIENHTEGQLQCTFEGCDKKFHKTSKLNRHMLSHTKQKNYHCDKCPASYSHATHLYRHQEAIHLGIRFSCEVPGCSTEFRRRDNYRIHLLKSHKNMDPTYIEELVKRVKEMKP